MPHLNVYFYSIMTLYLSQNNYVSSNLYVLAALSDTTSDVAHAIRQLRTRIFLVNLKGMAHIDSKQPESHLWVLYMSETMENGAFYYNSTLFPLVSCPNQYTQS